MTYRFLTEAREELFESARYYEGKEPGLGIRFREEVVSLIEQATATPLLWRERSDGYRRINCRVFPFYIAYFLEGDELIIAAVAHGSRRPDYWKGRKIF
jgi:plasmid stabilization system protein ParE